MSLIESGMRCYSSTTDVASRILSILCTNAVPMVTAYATILTSSRFLKNVRMHVINPHTADQTDAASRLSLKPCHRAFQTSLFAFQLQMPDWQSGSRCGKNRGGLSAPKNAGVKLLASVHSCHGKAFPLGSTLAADAFRLNFIDQGRSVRRDGHAAPVAGSISCSRYRLKAPTLSGGRRPSKRARKLAWRRCRHAPAKVEAPRSEARSCEVKRGDEDDRWSASCRWHVPPATLSRSVAKPHPGILLAGSASCWLANGRATSVHRSLACAPAAAAACHLGWQLLLAVLKGASLLPALGRKSARRIGATVAVGAEGCRSDCANADVSAWQRLLFELRGLSRCAATCG